MFFLSLFAPDNLVPRDGFGSPVPRYLLISELGLIMVLTYGIPLEFRGGIHLFISTAIHNRVSPEFLGSRNCAPMAFIAENPPAQRACKPQGSYKRVLRGQVAVDQLMRAFLSHTHYWCELGMLKVPNIFKVYIREKEMAHERVLT